MSPIVYGINPLATSQFKCVWSGECLLSLPALATASLFVELGLKTQFTAKFAITITIKCMIILIPATSPWSYIQLIFKILKKTYSEGL